MGIERCCLFCKQFRFDPGSQGYSEWTPGDSAAMTCAKRKFEPLYGENDFPADLPAFLIGSAAKCEDFALSDYALRVERG